MAAAGLPPCLSPRKTRPGRRRGAAWLLAAILLAGGCASQAPGTRISPAAFAVLTTSPAAATMEAGLNNAVELLIQRCMNSRRLIYYPSLESAAALESGSVRVPEFPAYHGLAQRRRHGYGLYDDTVRAARASTSDGTRPPGSTAADREQAYVDSLPAAARGSYIAADLGPPGTQLLVTLPGGVQTELRNGGCRAAAVRAIYGSMTNYAESITGGPLLSDDLLSTVEASPRFISTLRAWSRCMTGLGFHYSSPDEAFNDLAGEYRTRGPAAALRHREIAVATADYRCARQVSLVPATLALQRYEAPRLGAIAEAQLEHIAGIDTRAATRAKTLGPALSGSARP